MATTTTNNTRKNTNARKEAAQAAPASAPHRPGAFVWYEVRTRDVAAARALFSEVAGWRISEMPMGDATYTLASTASGPVAGIVPLESGRGELVAYVSVDDVDAALARVLKAGGSKRSEPFDVPTIGRMVEVSDPDGAGFFLFKSETGDAELQAAQGSVHWNELWAKDSKRAVAFLTSVLGYVVEVQDMGFPYHVLKAKSGDAGGVMQSPIDGPAHFLQYLQVDDVDAAVARARKHGCVVEGEPADVPSVGRFAVLRANDGVRFGVIKPAAR